ncbi:MAG: sel1 repeat family protein [Alphaproteobacteria bacterium]|nr:sel1 repeat family protein [Alphaproteobacteria bacterium]
MVAATPLLRAAAMLIAAHLGAPPVLAGFDEGRAALDRGDFAAAFQELLPAADAGEARAQLLIGFLIRAGAGVPADDIAAVRWFEKAAAQGWPEGQGALGVAYFLGRGVTQDYALAVQWLTRAADAGNADAQSNLGLMYLEGNGVVKSEQAARLWFEKAAAQDDSRAQMQLGVFSSQGLGGWEQSNVRALFWFTIVARKGEDDFAQAAMDLGMGLVEKMNDDDVMEAQRLAREWRAQRE